MKTPMDKVTLIALKGSIEKWEKIVDCEGRDNGQDDCSLCQLFVVCWECPVGKIANDISCRGTPHAQWCHYCYFAGQRPENGYFVFDKKSYELALAELNFLKSLLPEDTE